MSEQHEPPAQESAQERASAGPRFQSAKWWHEAVIDYIMLNPSAKQVEIAHHFRVSATYLNLLMNSDSFQRKLAERRQQLTQRIEETTLSRVQRLANATLDCMIERVAQQRNELSLGEVRETSEMALKALGYSPHNGAAAPQQPTVQFNFISREDLEDARNLMRRRQEPPNFDDNSRGGAAVILDAGAEGSRASNAPADPVEDDNGE